MRRLVLCGSSLCWVLCWLAVSVGADFRVENRVYVPESSEPLVETETVFCDGLVYDFATHPSQTAIFDPQGERFELLDAQRSVRAQVDMTTLAEHLEQMRLRAARHQRGLLRFLAEPRLKLRDESPDRLTLSSSQLQYVVELSSPRAEGAAAEYAAFCQASAQLNAMLQPAALPPFARMRVNTELAQRDFVPDRVRLVIEAQDGQPRQEFYSLHEFTWELSAADRARIAKVDAQRSEFRELDWDAYRRLSVAENP